MRREEINMTKRELQKLIIIQQTIERKLTVREAAQALGLSERQIFRLKKGVSEQGMSFVIHKNKGRKPANATSPEVVSKVIYLKQNVYFDANFSHFRDLLEEREGIILSQPTVYRILSSAGIKSHRRHHKTHKTHKRRKRKPQAGMLVQIDCSPFEWLPNMGKLALHGAIDDATGQVLGLYFTENESMEGYFEVMRQVITQYGIPIALYSDKHTIFTSPKKDKLSIEEQLEGKVVNQTQFERAMSELGISMIYASSPQAKGRVEKLWDTLQDRLKVELRLAGIDSIEKANEFLKEFLIRFNARFAVVAEDPIPAFRELPSNVDLDNILCIKETRIVDNGGGFSFKGNYYQPIDEKGKIIPVPPRNKIIVLTSSRIGIRVQYGNQVFATQKLDERPKKLQKPTQSTSSSKSKAHKPASNHPWKQNLQSTSLYWWEEYDRELIKSLYNSTCAWR